MRIGKRIGMKVPLHVLSIRQAEIFYSNLKVGIDAAKYILNKLSCSAICLKLAGCFGITKKRPRLFNLGQFAHVRRLSKFSFCRLAGI